MRGFLVEGLKRRSIMGEVRVGFDKVKLNALTIWENVGNLSLRHFL